MTANWAEFKYQVVMTSDGSPTLCNQSLATLEIMHHRGGAMGESRQVYGRLIEPLFQSRLEEPHFLSLGLGLGYNEALIAEQALLSQKSWKCVSYELDPILVENFLAFLAGQLPPGEILQTYESIFSFLRNPEQIKLELLKAKEEGRWVLQAALTPQSKVPFRIHGFLWDAFSQKTSPELWSEEFLCEVLQNWSFQGLTGLSTYACHGKLKRALKASGFEVQICEGYQGKRNSTLAWRHPSNQTAP